MGLRRKKSIVEMQREVARLQGKLRAQTERRSLRKQRKALRVATSRKYRFANKVGFLSKKYGLSLGTAAKLAAKTEVKRAKRKGFRRIVGEFFD